ncbi:MBL fold metallo-hydrolase [Alloyangia pacifica]|uniref:Glyoxylase, beta-lactamase superfamily II n=1 Tax=Alloyangia pacifica TaxID=311180 RepID=A0A1I6QXS0_9RHOB|nr:MBL fold metallo-hydrolase [Alloyangia pacifica]SDG04036.1 Glyoxylase, beta-lactamase superfamily II [Alloyangia pacifica]SFS57195.1 Glyoxylase, beta-lactamase superfamily II [Alloyangia pacifica]
MPLTRRHLLQSAAAAGLAPLMPRRLVAETTIGSGRLITVSDGNLVLPGDFIFAGMPEADLSDILAAQGIDRQRLTPECNVTLWQDGEQTVLFDVGAGSTFMDSAGELLGNLEAAGVSPEQVTVVVFTHAHPDHIWGLLDDFDDLVFPEARYLMGRAEWDYWWDPETAETIGTERQAFAVGARRRMEVIEDRIERFEDGAEILPGLAAILTPGHTPGHMAFELRQGNEATLIVGDAIGNDHVAFARPGWEANSDQDPELAARTRVALMDRLAQEQMPVIGFHLSEGGMGHVERTGDAYRYVPL